MISRVRRNRSGRNGATATAAGRNGHGHGAASVNGTANGETNGHARRRLSPAMQVSVLALNRNFAAVHVISVQRAFCLVWKGSAEIIDFDGGHYMSYDFDGWQENSQLKKALEASDDTEDWIRAVNFEIQVPRIIRLLSYDRIPRNCVKFNRRNIFLRDEHCCQYCQKRFPRQQLSLDHIQPRSRGGNDSWENVVCACLKCNVRKGGRTPQEAGMSLMKKPVKPKRSPLISRQLTDQRYASWNMFIHSD